ncbi:hypothetical protein ACFX2C_002584 [Malus domestica]
MEYYKYNVVTIDLYDKWFRVNTIHNVDEGKIIVFIDGVNKFVVKDQGPGDLYFKCGVYAAPENSRSRTGYPLVLVAKFDSKFEILRRMHECMSPQLNISNVFVEMFLRFGKSLLRSLNGLEIHERFKFAGASEHEGKDEEVEFRRQKFAGSQADRKEREEAEAVMVAAQLQKRMSQYFSLCNAQHLLVTGKQKNTLAYPEYSSGKKKQEPTTSAAESEISISRLDICVGLITKAEKHPDADIDAGEGQTRTVNRKQCVLCNLKSANMRGIKAQATAVAALNSETTPE